MSKPRHILVYRIGQIGDIVVALPAIWSVRRHFAEAHLALLGDAHPDGRMVPSRCVLPEAGLFDEWFSYPAGAQGSSARAILRTLPALRRRRFDALVYLPPRLRTQGQIRRDLLFFRMGGIRRFIGHRGFATLPSRYPGEPLPNVEHEADHLLRRLSLSGIPVPPAGEGRMDLALTAQEQADADGWLEAELGANRKTVVGVAPGSKWPSKCWPEAHYAELGRRLIIELGAHPIIFGGPEDAEVANRLIRAWGAGSSAAGVLGIRTAAAALRRCAIYVGNDTGTMHLAAAVGTRCVAVFSAQDWPGRWNPYGPGHTVLRRAVPCEGCQLPVCATQGLRCLREITVGEVLAACRRKLLERTPLVAAA